MVNMLRRFVRAVSGLVLVVAFIWLAAVCWIGVSGWLGDVFGSKQAAKATGITLELGQCYFMPSQVKDLTIRVLNLGKPSDDVLIFQRWDGYWTGPLVFSKAMIMSLDPKYVIKIECPIH